MLGERVGKSGAWRFCLPVPSPATGVEFLLCRFFVLRTRGGMICAVGGEIGWLYSTTFSAEIG